MWGTVYYKDGTKKREWFWSMEAVKHKASYDTVEFISLID